MRGGISRGNCVFQVVMIVLVLIFVCTTLPSFALPPGVEADRLLISATEKIDRKDFVEAGKIFDKIKTLNTRFTVEYFYQQSRYFVGLRQPVEAKKTLEEYLEKAGRDGKYYQNALKMYNEVEANEERWSRFTANTNDTVTDNITGLMWAAKDNSTGINWQNAKTYCQNYRAGGFSDWRMPTQDELAGLYDPEESQRLTPLIHLSGDWIWGSEKRETTSMFGTEATFFGFGYLMPGRQWVTLSSTSTRILPVRNYSTAYEDHNKELKVSDGLRKYLMGRWVGVTENDHGIFKLFPIFTENEIEWKSVVKNKIYDSNGSSYSYSDEKHSTSKNKIKYLDNQYFIIYGGENSENEKGIIRVKSENTFCFEAFFDCYDRE